MKTSRLVMSGFVLGILEICIFSGLVATSSTLAAEFRTWTSSMGNTVKAKYIRKEGLFVVLQRANGSNVKILYTNLSIQSQKYLAADSKAFKLVNRNVFAESDEVSLSDDEKKWQEQERIRRTQYRTRQREIRREDEQLHEWQRQEDARIRQGRKWELAEQARQEKERLEWERYRKEGLKFQAGCLADKIKRSERTSFPGYRSLANEADHLSMEADMVGESGASMGFGMAASKLREMERKSFYNERDDSSFGSSMNNNSRDAANDVEWGASSIGISYR